MKALEPILTFWLIPAGEARTFFSKLIAELAARFDAPSFEPHVTLYVSDVANQNPGSVLDEVLKHRRPYRLAIRGLDCSDEFAKTVFAQFEPDEELAGLSSDLRHAAGSQNDYKLNPHLSLIYKTMSDGSKAELARSLTLPFAEVAFDSVKAVVSPARINSREDVEAWRVVAEHKLSK